jgi:hypothetical protein
MLILLVSPFMGIIAAQPAAVRSPGLSLKPGILARFCISLMAFAKQSRPAG